MKSLKIAKFEAIRVETENKSLLNRILDIHGTVDVKDMRESYKKVVLYKKRQAKNSVGLIHNLLKNRQQIMENVNTTFLPKVKSL